MMDRQEELMGTEGVPVDDGPTGLAPDPVATGGVATTTDGGVATTTDGGLLQDAERDRFRDHWEQVQGQFVDDPRHAVEDADDLVSTVMGRLADGFAMERDRLEAMWARGEDVGTEDLRVALQRYREFFNRLLAA